MYRRISASIALFAFSMNLASAQSVAPSSPAAPVATQQLSPLLDQPRPVLPPEPPRENWSTLLLEKSNLPLAVPGGPVLSKIEGAGYTRELVRLQWRPADPIDLYVVRPKGVKNPPVILYLYDFTSEIDRFRDDGWCTRMTKNGFAAVGFASALSGPRIHMPRPLKQWFVSELQESLAASTHDVQMVLKYLGARGDIDVAKVGIFGQGSSGAIALLAAAADPQIVAVDVMDPWGDWPDWLKSSPQVPEEERPLYTTPEFLSKVAPLDPVTVLPGLHTTAIRIQQTLDDDVTPHSVQDKIKDAAPKPEDVVRYKDWSTFRQAYSDTGLSAWLQAQVRLNLPSGHPESSQN